MAPIIEELTIQEAEAVTAVDIVYDYRTIGETTEPGVLWAANDYLLVNNVNTLPGGSGEQGAHCLWELAR